MPLGGRKQPLKDAPTLDQWLCMTIRFMEEAACKPCVIVGQRVCMGTGDQLYPGERRGETVGRRSAGQRRGRGVGRGGVGWGRGGGQLRWWGRGNSNPNPHTWKLSGVSIAWPVKSKIKAPWISAAQTTYPLQGRSEKWSFTSKAA